MCVCVYTDVCVLGDSAHLPVSESSLSSVSTVHTQAARNVPHSSATYFGAGAVELQGNNNNKKRRDLWDLMWNCCMPCLLFIV